MQCSVPAGPWKPPRLQPPQQQQPYMRVTRTSSESPEHRVNTRAHPHNNIFPHCHLPPVGALMRFRPTGERASGRPNHPRAQAVGSAPSRARSLRRRRTGSRAPARMEQLSNSPYWWWCAVFGSPGGPALLEPAGQEPTRLGLVTFWAPKRDHSQLGHPRVTKSRWPLRDHLTWSHFGAQMVTVWGPNRDQPRPGRLLPGRPP